MKNDWKIMIGNQEYAIRVKGTKVLINNESFKLSQLPFQRQAIFFRETKLPIDGAEVLLAPAIASVRLIVDGKDISTGEAYHSMSKVPKWAYVFFVLHALNLMNGAIGGAMAFIGIFFTARISADPDWSTGKKVLYNILFLLAWIVISMVILFFAVYLLNILL